MIELHLFTNSTVHAPSIDYIENTYNSFIDTFKYKLNPTVWCDPSPNRAASEEYINNLKNKFNLVNITDGFSQGYHQAVKNSTSEFMIMLEHDWDFIAKNIQHTLPEIIDGMREDNILHLRFNKRENRNNIGWDLNVSEVKGKVFDFCTTDCVSNNPHIINRQRWLNEAIKHTRYVGYNGAYGIEEFLTASSIRGAIYGPIGHPSTIYHTDGRHLTRKYS